MIALPELHELPGEPKRIIMHWTAGRHRFSVSERKRYHGGLESRVVEGQEVVRWVPGVAIERNMGRASNVPTAHSGHPEASTLGYAAHTGRLNSYSVGLALCGMWQATDFRPSRPVDPGPEPITRMQVEAWIHGLAQVCRSFRLEPIPEQLHDHWEAHHVHGVTQRGGVWDLQWIPGENLTRGEVGGWIRSRVRRVMRDRTVVAIPEPQLEAVRWPVVRPRSVVPRRVFPAPR